MRRTTIPAFALWGLFVVGCSRMPTNGTPQSSKAMPLEENCLKIAIAPKKRSFATDERVRFEIELKNQCQREVAVVDFEHSDIVPLQFVVVHAGGRRVWPADIDQRWLRRPKMPVINLARGKTIQFDTNLMEVGGRPVFTLTPGTYAVEGIYSPSREVYGSMIQDEAMWFGETRAKPIVIQIHEKR